MQKPFKIFIYLLIAVPILFIGCQKSEVLDDSSNSNASKGVDPKKSTIAYSPCGSQLNANLYISDVSAAGDLFGTLTVGNDATKLYLTFKLTEGSSYFLNGLFYYVGPESGLPVDGVEISPGVVSWASLTSAFPNQWGMNNKSHTIAIDLSTLPDCFVVVAFARVSLNASVISNDPTLKYISARPIPKTGLKTHQGYLLYYCKQVCGSGCETAYAYGKDKANCFLTIPGVTSNNWGWSNGPIGAGTYNWPIYAGAGQCNTSKGTLVGTLNVVYTPPSAKITYVMGGNVHLSTTQLYVGSLILPKKNNKWTTAPGQFPYKHENLKGVNTDSFTINGLTGKIYIAAHSDVCW